MFITFYTYRSCAIPGSVFCTGDVIITKKDVAAIAGKVIIRTINAAASLDVTIGQVTW